jgi:hypothetical protein
VNTGNGEGIFGRGDMLYARKPEEMAMKIEQVTGGVNFSSTGSTGANGTVIQRRGLKTHRQGCLRDNKYYFWRR